MSTPTNSRERRTFTVEGMTCEHCANSVTEEVSEVAGVDHVEVDLPAGSMIVSGNEFSDDAVATAVETAGYKIA